MHALSDAMLRAWSYCKCRALSDAVLCALYKLKGHPEQALVHDTIEPSELWHRRLAHVHYRALPIASKGVEGIPEIQAKDDGVYKGCEKGKKERRHFQAAKAKQKESWKSSTPMYAVQCHPVY